MGQAAPQGGQRNLAHGLVLRANQGLRLRMRIGGHSPNQAHDHRIASRGGGGQAERGRQHGPQNIFERERLPVGLGFELPKQVELFLAHWPKAAFEDGFEQTLFRAEVIVNGREVDVGGGDDGAERRPLETADGKNLFRGIKDALFPH